MSDGRNSFLIHFSNAELENFIPQLVAPADAFFVAEIKRELEFRKQNHISVDVSNMSEILRLMNEARQANELVSKTIPAQN